LCKKYNIWQVEEEVDEMRWRRGRLREKQHQCLETQCLSAGSTKQRKRENKNKETNKRGGKVTTHNVNPWYMRVNVVFLSLLNGHSFITIMLASYDTLHLAKYYLTFQHVYACHVGNITSGLCFSQNYYHLCLLLAFFFFLFHQLLLRYLKYIACH